MLATDGMGNDNISRKMGIQGNEKGPGTQNVQHLCGFMGQDNKLNVDQTLGYLIMGFPHWVHNSLHSLPQFWHTPIRNCSVTGAWWQSDMIFTSCPQ